MKELQPDLSVTFHMPQLRYFAKRLLRLAVAPTIKAGTGRSSAESGNPCRLPAHLRTIALSSAKYLTATVSTPLFTAASWASRLLPNMSDILQAVAQAGLVWFSSVWFGSLRLGSLRLGYLSPAAFKRQFYEKRLTA